METIIDNAISSYRPCYGLCIDAVLRDFHEITRMRYPTYQYYEAMRDFVNTTNGGKNLSNELRSLILNHSGVSYWDPRGTYYLTENIYYNLSVLFVTGQGEGDMRLDCAYAMKSICARYENNPDGPIVWDPKDEWKKCYDMKCNICQKCRNPSASYCVRCECPHYHKNCTRCSKCIKPAYDYCSTGTRSASHSVNCPTCTCACPGCKAKIDPNTGIYTCAGEFQCVYEKYFAYKMMWEMNSTEDGNENSAFLLFDETVVVNFSERNEYKSSAVGLSYSCPWNSGYRYVFKYKNEIVYPGPTIGYKSDTIRVAIKALVHPHPSPKPSSKITLQGRPGMLSAPLGVSTTDIDEIRKLRTTGYILNHNDVYQFNTDSYYRGVYKDMADSIKYFCPIIDHF